MDSKRLAQRVVRRTQQQGNTRSVPPLVDEQLDAIFGGEPLLPVADRRAPVHCITSGGVRIPALPPDDLEAFFEV